MRASLIRNRLVATGAGLGLALASSAALAQVEQLPPTSRGESQVNSLNGQIQNQQQIRGITQQNQFETNQLRTQIQTAPSPPPVAAPPYGQPIR